MIIRLFTGNQLITWIILPVIAIVLWLWAASNSFPVYYDSSMPFYFLLIHWIESQPRFLVLSFSLLLVFVQSIHLNYIIRKYNVLYKSSHVPALVYLFMMSLAPPITGFHPLLLVNSLWILALGMIFKLYKQNQPMRLDFDISLLISLASLFYFPAILYYGVYLLALAMISTFSWRDIIISLLGLVLPYVFVAFAFFYTDHWSELLHTLKEDSFRGQIDPGALLLSSYQLSFYFILILFVAGILRLANNFYKNVTQTRRYQQIILIVTIFSVLIIMFSSSYGVYRYCLLCIPFSVVLSYLFISGKRKWFNEIIFVLFVAVILYNYWLG